MSVNDNLLGVQKLFERLSIELYHGFNMRMILNDLRTNEPATYRKICYFVEWCKQEKGKIKPDLCGFYWAGKILAVFSLFIQ